MFSVYPQGPPARRGTNPIVFVLLGCGGCALLALLAFMALGYFFFRTGEKYLNAFEKQSQEMTAFLSDVQKHDYAAAVARMSPEGQQALSVETLKQLAEGAEKRLGKMKSWKAQQESTDAQGQQTEFIFSHRFLVTYEKGKALAIFSFRSKDPFNPSIVISDFDLKSAESEPGDSNESGEGTDKKPDTKKSGTGKTGNAKSDFEGGR